ncbi:MAG TPA: hypothetical protein VM889_08860, partial [Candidatus Thermoplasmatota archaeon]|nr:hypothetical protein [Candidatus Thermoplasmatota archaeon]
MRPRFPGRRIALGAVAAVAISRAWVYVFSSADAGDPEGTVIGQVVAINGFHVHHAYFGAALLALAVARLLARPDAYTALATGFGAGLVLDEVGLILSGFTSYWELQSVATSAASLVLFVAGMVVLEARTAP